MSSPDRARLVTVALLVAAGGCGASPAAPVPDAPSGGDSAAGDRDDQGGEPGDSQAEPVTAFLPAESHGMFWLDLTALRTLPTWPELRAAIEPSMAELHDFEVLFGDERLSPFDVASRVTVGERWGFQVLTIDYPSSVDLEAEVTRLRGDWVDLHGYPATALSAGDDSSVVARDGASRLVLGAPGEIRGALRDGPVDVEPYWDRGDLLALELWAPERLASQQRRVRAALRPGGTEEVAIHVWFELAEEVDAGSLDLDRARAGLAELAPGGRLDAAAERLRLSLDGSTVHLVLPLTLPELTVAMRTFAAHFPVVPRGGRSR